MTTISFTVSAHEAQELRRQAKLHGIGVPELLRRKAGLSAAPPEKPRTVRCPHAGAMVFAAPKLRASLSTQAVRDLLADLP